MDTPLVVDTTERFHPKFKKNPFKLVEDDPLGAFSSVSYGVLHVEDIRTYIHSNLEELGGSQFLNLYTKHILGEDLKAKPEFKVLKENNFA